MSPPHPKLFKEWAPTPASNFQPFSNAPMGETHRGRGRSTTSCPGKNKRRRKYSPLPLQVVRDKRLVTLTPLESMGGGNIFLSARKEGRRWRSKTLQMPAGKTVSAKKSICRLSPFSSPPSLSPMSSSPIFAEEKMGGKKNVAALLSTGSGGGDGDGGILLLYSPPLPRFYPWLLSKQTG